LKGILLHPKNEKSGLQTQTSEESILSLRGRSPKQSRAFALIHSRLLHPALAGFAETELISYLKALGFFYFSILNPLEYWRD
jgi:hypothetical protein